MRSFAVFIALVATATASCPNLCSGNGRCGADDLCTCYRGYTEMDCSGRKCPYGRAWVDGSTSDAHSFAECSNKGSCDRATGMCDCVEGYEGSACQRSSCPNSCSGHGECRYVEEVSANYSSTAWDSGKIQGCVCDPGYDGIDCSEKLCPLGDDPMTVATSTHGQTWEARVTFHSLIGPPTTAEMHLEIQSLEDNRVVSTRPIDMTSSSTSDADSALIDSGIVNSLVSSTISTDVFGYNYTFTLQEPLRLKHVRVRWEDDCTVAGCNPRRQAAVPSGIVLSGSSEILTEAESAAESVACSNRGSCDTSVGKCECFEGFYGRACESQTVLI